jgi:hypothetical protein
MRSVTIGMLIMSVASAPSETHAELLLEGQ